MLHITTLKCVRATIYIPFCRRRIDAKQRRRHTHTRLSGESKRLHDARQHTIRFGFFFSFFLVFVFGEFIDGSDAV